ncbi:uncharacterized protein LOC115059258 [Echeneis naucrates]|uniref:uncharacterized protein LOC115059258 n=1 Tax=Echeneis naucrates TaxID=173247 RepID=UPI0011142C79|nr:uncharacterized protein LOC115059258 [Echeneis naucrates]
MVNTPVLTVLLVTLSCMAMNSYAQSAAGVNMTTAAPTNMTTATPSNMTTATPSNMTTAAPSNMTTAAVTNVTTAAPSNMTTAGVTNMTTAAPLTPNITVTPLEMPLSRQGCGSEQLCAAEPSNCNPSSAGCFFLGARRQSGRNFACVLAGQSAGYIAATLSLDGTVGNNDTTYVCANNNGKVRFFSTVLVNETLIETELPVNSVRGRVNGTTIQCSFSATTPSATSQTSSLTLLVSTGSFNSTSGTLGAPTTKLRSSGVNLANPNTTVVNDLSFNATTTAPNVTPNMTTAAPLTPNITVTPLEMPLSRQGCGSEQLCAAEPSNCNPSSAGCFFLGARRQSGRNFACVLAGQSAGYIAATLSLDGTVGNNDTTYVCANNNGKVRFFSTVLVNETLIETELPVNSVRGRVNGTTIQCSFSATIPSATSQTSSLTLLVSTGSFNSTSGTLGAPTTKLRSSGVNLANPNTTVVNDLSFNATTTAPNVTPNMTTAAPLTPNITVTPLEMPLSRQGCGSEQLCAAEPSNCNPSSAGCFFLGARRQSGRNFACVLAGQSAGYIAATLSLDGTVGNNDTTYVCANNNGKVRFFSTVLVNETLIETELPVNSVRGRVNGTTIQCSFSATIPSATSQTSSLTLLVSTGSFNSTSGTLGAPTTKLRSSGVNLANPNTTVVNDLSFNATTTAPNVTPNMTTAAPLTPNITVTPLEMPLSRQGCGSEQLCAAEPSNCNPSSAGCFFLGARRQSGRNFACVLAGQSAGYIAATLSLDGTVGNNDTTYVCANNNGKVRFFSTVLVNETLIETELPVNSVRGRVNGTTIQCSFSATTPSATSQTSSLTLLVSTGSFNSTSGTLGAPTTKLRSSGVNLANPNTTVVNDLSFNATTTAPNVTPNMTTAAPLTPNITVTPLEMPLSRQGCGSEQLCAAEPSNCNPSSAGCFFLGARRQSGRNFACVLAGQSAGYIAATLSLDGTVGNNDTTYVCANNNGKVRFFSTVLVNETLIETELPVNSVRGRVNGTTIQCSFSATIPSATSQTSSLTLLVSTGSFNSTSGTLGAPTTKLRSSGVNLANPNTTVVNDLSFNATTTAPNVTPNMTTAAPLTPNITVTPLEMPLSRQGCGSEQLCAAEPSNCNPSSAGCFFLGARRQSGRNFACVLAGQSAGYIAATLSLDGTVGNNDTTYVCANNNGKVRFFSTVLVNETLIETELPVNSVRGRVNGTTIQCSFSATTSKCNVSDIFFDPPASGTLGAPTTKLRSSGVNLANPNTTVVNDLSFNATTTAPNVTPNMTTAAPLTPNITVTPLEMPLSRQGCGSEQLCAAEPSNCNPSSAGCFFLGARRQSGRNFACVLAGQSAGYIAATLSLDGTVGNNDTTYVCANNNGKVRFFSTVLVNETLIETEVSSTCLRAEEPVELGEDLPVNSVRGRVNGTTIQCSFSATTPSATSQTSSLTLLVSTGSFNSTSGTLGAPTTKLRSSGVNLANPNTTVVNDLSFNATTTAPNVTPNMTTAAPLTPNITVTPLEMPLSRQGCGSEQLCAAEPSNCNPSSAGCFFLGARRQSGRNFACVLAGQSAGYIAATLSLDGTVGNNDTTYVCANNNGKVRFFSTVLVNETLIETEVSSTCLRAEEPVELGEDVFGSLAVDALGESAHFLPLLPSATSQTSSLTLLVSTGSFNSTSGTLGAPTTKLRSSGVNLANPNTTVVNDLSFNATTTAPNVTPNMTTAAPLTPNITVTPLEMPLSRQGCGSEQLCAAEPSNCNPSSAGCFFLGARRQSGRNFACVLAGQSAGYIAATLSLDGTVGNNDTTYVCANNNGKVRFFSTVLVNETLIETELPVNSVRGRVNGTTIQCSFSATIPSATSQTSSLTLLVSTGSFNSTSGTLGAPTTKLRSSGVNLANPNTTVVNDLSFNATTTAPNVTPNMTTAAPLTPNITVTPLEMPLSRQGCGSEQLCAAEPSNCNPSSAGCFFLGARRQSGRNFACVLAGQSAGYIAATLSLDGTVGNNDTTYVCANNNGKVRFFSTVLVNETLIETELPVNSVRGRVNGTTIQCSFSATTPSATSQTSSLTLLVSTGSFNSTSGTLGAPTTKLRSSGVNLANPNTTVVNDLSFNATTTAPNVTPNMTTAAPLTPNITVTPLEMPLSRQGCGSEQLCAAEPSNCNPSSAGCFFLGARRQSGRNFACVLAGQSAGYIAATLSLDGTVGNNDTTYVCANNNGKVRFFSTVLVNETLIETELPVNSVRGRVNGTTIQCSFSATIPSATSQTSSLTLLVSTGSFNSTSGTLGAPTTKLRSSGVNLANPNTTVVNDLSFNATTTAPNVTPNMTTAAPLTPNITVTPLEMPLSRQGCGSEQLCAAEPSNCNPSSAGCFFLGARRQSGRNFACVLAGQSAGYIAATLSLDGTVGNNDTTYVCANNNGKVRFFSTVLVNETLIETELPVNSVRGRVNGTTIQCSFSATIPSATSQTSSLTLLVSTGSFNSTSGTLGAPTTKLRSSGVNLANPNTTVVNDLSFNATTTAPNVTPNMTTAAPLTPNITVTPLEMPLSRQGCGSEQLCAAEPSNCNPSSAGCFFLGARRQSGRNFACVLAGQSAGYIAATLSLDGTVGNNDTTYVCANNNGKVRFFSTVLVNETLIETELPVNSVRGRVNGTTIQCSFSATIPSATSQTSSLTLLVSTGSFNSTSGTLGAPTTKLRSSGVNLANPNTTVVNDLSFNATTTAPNVTPNMTTAAPLTPNITVTPLEMPLSRQGCGSEQLCAAEPSNCNPSSAGCFFLGARRQSGRNFACVLAGQSAGYIAATLSLDGTVGNNDTTYVCANNNGKVRFFSTVLVNETLIETELPVNSVRGRVNGTTIQCSFSATIPSATSQTSSLTLLVSTGSFNSTSGTLGAPTTKLRSSGVNLANPNTTVVNDLSFNATTTAPNVTPNMTTAAPLTPNITVTPLEMPLSRQGCGSEQLCAAEPSNCNPSSAGCFFLGARRQSGRNFACVLAGQSAGYIAATLSLDGTVGNNDTTYVCANNNGKVRFFSTVLVNETLIETELPVNSVRGRVNGTTIQCSFSATIPSATSQTSSLTLLVSTGSFNSTSGTLGAPTTKLRSSGVNLANPNTTVVNDLSFNATTTAPNVTPNMTTAAPLTPNITVTPLEMPLSRQGCGSEQLCAAEPSNCNPSSAGCFFLGARRQSGRNFACVLAGQSAGYIAATLSLDGTVGNNDTTYVCANNNGKVRFFSTVLVNETLIETELPVNSVRGRVNGTTIQCSFSATIPSATSQTSSLTLLVSTGSFNSTSGTLGAPTTKLRSSGVNLANPNTTVVNDLSFNATTTAPNVTPNMTTAAPLTPNITVTPLEMPLSRQGCGSEQLCAAEPSNCNPSSAGCFFLGARRQSGRNFACVLAGQSAGYIAATLSLDGTVGNNDTTYVCANNNGKVRFFSTVLVNETLIETELPVNSVRGRVNGTTIQCSFSATIPSATSQTSSLTLLVSTGSFNSTSGTLGAPTTKLRSSGVNLANPNTTVVNDLSFNATTTAPNVTPNMTTAAPLTPNITVTPLEMPLSRQGCGSEQLCAAEPSNCNPSSAGCFFLGARRQSGRNFACVLAGQSAGYIAATLSLDGTVGNNDTTYVCANNNGKVRFFSTVLVNETLIETELPVNSVRGRVNGTTIQCSFSATTPSATSQTSSLTLLVSTGSFNSTSGTLGAPTTKLRSSGVNLANPNTTVVNDLSFNATTTAPNVTPNMTTAAPLTPNITVTPLEMPLSRQGCGSEQLCAAEPSNCNPSSAGCFFLGARRQSGRNFACVLAGQSAGYIAATLSLDGTVGNNDTTYVCANNNGKVRFFSTVLVNETLIETELPVNSVKGRVNGTTIQCSFSATTPSATSQTSSLTLLVSTGSFNSTSGTLGAPTTKLRSSGVNLANPNTTVVNDLSFNATTTAPNVTPNMTTAAPLTPNITVTPLEMPLSRQGCGSEQLCAAEPSNCNPSSAGCFFLGARRQSGRNFACVLAGQSAGYIAATLSLDGTVGNNDTTYVCANNNGKVRFFSTVLVNETLIETELPVNSVRGRVNGTTIQCSFSATIPSATSQTSSLTLLVSTGSFNSTSGTLGAPTTKLRSSGVNLANPNTTVVNDLSFNATTTAPNVTPNMTTAAPLTPNITVTPLEMPLSRQGCGSEQLCAAEPSNCNPSSAGCFFLGARRQSGRNFACVLAGQSAGYIAATLSLDGTVGNNDTTYVCANNNGKVRFFSTVLVNETLIETELPVNSVRGRVNGTTIQCSFSATIPSATSQTSSLTLLVSTGSFNSTSGTLGAPTTKLRSSGVNLANPNTTVVNDLSFNATTTAPNVTPNMTTAAPLTPNITVTPLEMPLSRQGCGSEQLCAAEPSNCNPSSAGCFFLGARRQSGRNFACVMAGQSAGYIAATLSLDGTVGNNDTTYVCANNNGKVRFFSTVLVNETLIETELPVNSVRGRVNGTTIQCSFSATIPSQRLRNTNFAVQISSGPFNSTSGTLGAPTTQLRSSGVNLANPNTTVVNDLSFNTTTTAPNVTPNMTTAAPLTPNITVTPLEMPLSRQGCGSEQLCAAEPSNCNPSSAGCFFLGARRQSGRNFACVLAGQSAGYIAATLSLDGTVGNNDTTYVCANNNGKVRFFSTVLVNEALIETELPVNSVRGRVNGTTIQCSFSATIPSQRLRNTNFAVQISSGPFNSTSGTLGAPTAQFRSTDVDLTNFNATVTNEISNTTTTAAPSTTVPTTAAPTTTVPTTAATTANHAITFRQSLTQALLIFAGVLGLAIL